MAVKIAPVFESVAGGAGEQRPAGENKFHFAMQTKGPHAVNVVAAAVTGGRRGNPSMLSPLPPVRAKATRKLDCARAIFREQFVSVRDYGLRTYEPRQSRNAATVV